MRENWPLRLNGGREWGGGTGVSTSATCGGGRPLKTHFGPELTSAMSSCTLRLLPQWLICEGVTESVSRPSSAPIDLCGNAPRPPA